MSENAVIPENRFRHPKGTRPGALGPSSVDPHCCVQLSDGAIALTEIFLQKTASTGALSVFPCQDLRANTKGVMMEVNRSACCDFNLLTTDTLLRYKSEWDPRKHGLTKGGYLEGEIRVPKVVSI